MPPVPQQRWTAELLNYCNSGDISGDKHHLAAYSAVGFYEPPRPKWEAADRRFLLDLARATLMRAAADPDVGSLDFPEQDVPARLKEPAACFVTLTLNGALRGCIGHVKPQEPLYSAVMHNAQNAATRDPRFSPVLPDEVPDIRIEISVLSEPQPLNFSSPGELLEKLQPGVDGVLLRVGPRSATFLPQVWGQIHDKTEFLNQLARKAGCAPSAWKDPGSSILIYRVDAFHEDE